jgi:hypothetical protein
LNGAFAQGLSGYVGYGVQVGTREQREVSNGFVGDVFFDYGVAENALVRATVDRYWALAGVYVFQEVSMWVRPYAGVGAAKDPRRGPWRADGRLGLALLGFGTSNLLIEGRWLQTSADVTLGMTFQL